MRHQLRILFSMITAQILFSCGVRETVTEREKYLKIKLGDSIFCDYGKYKIIKLGKIERVPIVSREELQRLAYARKDTNGFVSDSFELRNRDEYFYKQGSSFIGFCVGKDSVNTENDGKYFLKIEPSILLRDMIKDASLLNLKDNEKVYVFRVEDVFLENQFVEIEKK